MALPWLTVLKHVPWSDVIANAPKVAEGARKLWKGVSGKPDETVVDEHEELAWTAEPDPVARLVARVAHLEARLGKLGEQMRASSELIDALAGQNAQLVERLDASQKRLKWLVRGVLGLGVALLGLALAQLY
ncbi:MAG: hypothetical protein AB1899_03875 [Pseudomonadota bacterium]